MEKAYRVMRNSGAGNIAIGIILLVTGVTVGIISIINVITKKATIEIPPAYFESLKIVRETITAR